MAGGGGIRPPATECSRATGREMDGDTEAAYCGGVVMNALESGCGSGALRFGTFVVVVVIATDI